MDAVDGCVVSGCLAQALRLGRVFGIAPLSFVKERTGWRVCFSRRWNIFGRSCVICIIVGIICTLFADLCRPQRQSLLVHYNVNRVIWHVKYLTVMSLAGISVFGGPDRMRSMITCVNYLQKINSELKVNIGRRSELMKIYFLFFWVIVTFILVSVSMYLLFKTQLDIFDEDSSPSWIKLMLLANRPAYMFLYCNTQTQMMVFIVLALHVVHSFKLVNDSLMQILNETVPSGVRFDVNKRPAFESTRVKLGTDIDKCFNNKVDVISKSERLYTDYKLNTHHDTIHSLSLVYVSTCDVVKEVNYSFGFFLLIKLAMFLLRLVESLYNMLNSLFAINSVMDSWMYVGPAVIDILWTLYHMTNLVSVMEPAHITHVEMEKTRELVSRLMYCTQSNYDPMAVELELFSRHLKLNHASYSPMKVVTLKRSLAVTILASITSYLVVLVQL